MIEHYSNTKANVVKKNIQSWLNDKAVFPRENSDEEYSFFAEKALPIEEDRKKYFQKLASTAIPSLGYHLVSYMSELGIFKTVWTTNFDGLVEKCAHQYKLAPISITGETSERFYRGDVDGELLVIALHGDYKYGKLKNTVNEIDAQSENLINALKFDITNKDLIVIGYSGRDTCLMNALKQAYSVPGSGKLFWCGYGEVTNEAVSELIEYVNSNNRTAYYIATNGFDETIYCLARHSLSDDKVHLQNIEKIKGKLVKLAPKLESSFSSYSVTTPKKIVDTNLYPVVIPKSCYQFELNYDKEEKPWDYCKKLYTEGIMAVPYKQVIYAFGEKNKIVKICGKKIKSEILYSPLSKETIKANGNLKELILKTIVAVLAQNKGLSFSKDKIWDINLPTKYLINGKLILAYQGISISLILDDKYIYISCSPTYAYDSSIILSKEEKKQFSDLFNNSINGKSPNENIQNYISSWINRLTDKTVLKLPFPVDSIDNVFVFKIGSNSANLKVNNNSHYKVNLPDSIPEKRLVFNAVECIDPELVFFNQQRGKLATYFHPMRGLINNAPVDIPLNVAKIKTSIALGVVCPQLHNLQFVKFLEKLNNKCDVKYNTEYVIPFPSFYEAFKTNINIPSETDEKWQDLSVDKTTTIKQFCEMLARKIDKLSAMSVDVVVIYIPKEYECFTSYSDDNEVFDLHDYIKAYAAQKQISTQFVREKTIVSDMLCQILWALSLAIYVKSNRIPWIVSETYNDTAVAGIGYSVQHSSNGTNIVIGCSHVYSADGQGLKYKLSRLHDFTLDKKKNPYLSENEAYKLGLNIKELFYSSFSEMPKRVVVHKRTPFSKEEIKGLTESLSSAGIKNIDLIEITYEDDIKCFAYNKNLDGPNNFPVKRGLCFPINKNTMFLYTHGIAPSVISESRSYIQGGKSIPMPLKIVNHYGNSTMQQIATEILGLSKMNWNSFGLYTKLPCTIASSNEIARIGRLLSQYEGALYEYRFFM